MVIILDFRTIADVPSFGIPPQLKRQMEEKALETMGENKASYMMKDAIGRVPASDQEVSTVITCFRLRWSLTSSTGCQGVAKGPWELRRWKSAEPARKVCKCTS